MVYLMPLALALICGGFTFWLISKREEMTARREEDEARLRRWQEHERKRTTPK